MDATVAPLGSDLSRNDQNTEGWKHWNDTRRIPSCEQAQSDHIVGNYILGKTLGNGRLGRIKLATHSISGDKFAVKIIPRNFSKKAASNLKLGVSQETRVIREATLSMLLQHPHICRMHETIVHDNYYYMVSEYLNGGSMLDYISTHGRLREQIARKFARQISSALQYCHLNNVVHRDLKIENVLLSEMGNIKIVDFGISNLFDPASYLSTFCGSAHFAAPELLSANVYTGPEVDIWSFGVLIYVLVCGKVPFDDQDIPSLEAKIRSGVVEYPIWLSTDCKRLLSRILVTNPSERASLHEIMGHPWMVLGFTGPEPLHMLYREPLRADEIDRRVIQNMKGFEYGTEDEIERKLIDLLESKPYKKALQHRKHYVEGMDCNGLPHSVTTLFGKTQTPSPLEQLKELQLNDARTDNLSDTSIDTDRKSSDPTLGFHPLISIYHLVREKMKEMPRNCECSLNESSCLACMKRDGNPSISSQLVGEGRTEADVEEISRKALPNKLLAILSDKDNYRTLLNHNGKNAQKILNCIHLLLDDPGLETSVKRTLTVALVRLSKKSGLYPQCLTLRDVNRMPQAVEAGHFGEIFEGTFMKQRVCLKVVKVYQKSCIEKLLKAFSKEATLWGQLVHPNLLPFYGIYHLEDLSGRICLVSPWMFNGNVNEYLKHNPNIQRLLLVSDITHGVSYIHDNGIIHGDLKGPNILVGESGRARVGDFGLSTVMDSEALRWTSIESSAHPIGTARWQAPELISPSDGDYLRGSKESDIYTLSCVFYEIFTGRFPFFEIPRDYTVTLKIMSGERPSKPTPYSLSYVSWGLTGEMWNLIQRCWDGEPKNRLSSRDILDWVGNQNVNDDRQRDDEYISPSQFRNSMHQVQDDMLQEDIRYVCSLARIC